MKLTTPSLIGRIRWLSEQFPTLRAPKRLWDKVTENALRRPFEITSQYAVVVFFAAVIVLSILNRPVYDDLTIIGLLHNHSIWGTVRFAYATWSGRFSYIFLQALLAYIFPFQTWISPILCTAAFYGGLYYFVRQWLSRAAALQFAGLALICIAGITFFTLQDWFWQSANADYSIAVSLTLIASRWLIVNRFSTRKPLWMAAFVIGAVLSGFNEVATACWGIAAFLIALAPLVQERKLDPVATLCLVGACIGAAIEITSPGNHIRFDKAVHAPLSTLPHATIQNLHRLFHIQYNPTIVMYWDSIWTGPTIYVDRTVSYTALLILGAFIYGRKSTPIELKRAAFWIASIGIVASAIAFLAMAVNTYAGGGGYLPRSVFETVLVVVASWASSAFILGRYTIDRNFRPMKAMYAAALVCFALSLYDFVPTLWTYIGLAHTTAVAWDNTNISLQKAASLHTNTVTTPDLNAWWDPIETTGHYIERANVEGAYQIPNVIFKN